MFRDYTSKKYHYIYQEVRLKYIAASQCIDDILNQIRGVGSTIYE